MSDEVKDDKAGEGCEASEYSALLCGTTYIGETAPVRTERTAPDAYRLGKKPNGELVLQGAYMWEEGNKYGHEWREIPTVDIDA